MNFINKIEKFIEKIVFNDVEFEVVERPDVIWVGCVDYARDNIAESDTNKTLKRYREELIDIPKLELINPDWSASISINYDCDDKPCGIMFSQETYSDKQDKRYDILIQPSGLWLRILNNKKAATLLNKENPAPYEYFNIMKSIAEKNGYMVNNDVNLKVEYHCHAEYNNPPHRNYAYIPVKRMNE